MKLEKEKRVAILEAQELNIATLAITELGGPLHSLLAKHLNRNHENELKRLSETLYEEKTLPIENIGLLIDAISVLLEETPKEDFGTYYENLTQENVKRLYDQLKQVAE